MRDADFGAFLVSGALYRQEVIENPNWNVYTNESAELHVPDPIDRECQECGLTKWKLTAPQPGRIGDGFSQLTWQCRNCQKSTLRVWLLWAKRGNTALVIKTGQYPKLEVTIPKEFENALGDKRHLYIKGMTSRHNGYGIGALTVSPRGSPR